jgi:hypothetical protein
MPYLEKTRQPDVVNSSTLSQNPSGEVYGTLINLSGRRRFTSQRVVLFAVLASQGRDGALQSANDALTAFREAHAALIAGTDQVPGIFCDELQDAYFGAAQGDKVIRDFIGLARRALDAVASRAPGAPPLLERLVESATPLLAVLNGITQIYDDLARRRAALAKKQLTAVMSDIESIAKHAHIVAFNAQVVAARAGPPGREFSVVASELSRITGQIDGLVREALRASVA